MSGIFGFVFALACAAGGLVFGRWIAGRRMTDRSVRRAIAFWDDDDRGAALTRATAGVLGWYLGVVAAFVIALTAAGETVIDDTSLRVRVAEDGPAARAGILDGDRVVAIDGAPVHDWQQIKEAVRGPSETARVSVDRGGAAFDVTVEKLRFPGGMGVIRISPFVERREVPFARSVVQSVLEPGRILAAAGRAFFGILKGGAAEAVGPVGIVSEATKVPGWDAVRFGASIAAYVWPMVSLASVLAALLVSRRR